MNRSVFDLGLCRGGMERRNAPLKMLHAYILVRSRKALRIYNKFVCRTIRANIRGTCRTYQHNVYVRWLKVLKSVFTLISNGINSHSPFVYINNMARLLTLGCARVRVSEGCITDDCDA